MTNTNTKTKTKTKTNTFREHTQRAILETCDLWDIWSERWGDMTWPKKYNDKYKYKDKDKDKDKYILRTHSKSDPRNLWPLRHLIRVMRRHDLANKKMMTHWRTLLTPTHPSSPQLTQSPQLTKITQLTKLIHFSPSYPIPNSTNSSKSPQLTQKTKNDPPLMKLWKYWQIYWLHHIPHDIW